MRMERINEHQVRCVITLQDLEAHRLSSGDLKYGTKEIKELFNEVIGRAVEQYRFNEDHLPVMIEAIPIQGGELLVILSAVENAEELDPHFAHFQEAVEDDVEEEENKGFPVEEAAEEKVCLFRFEGMSRVMEFCRRISRASLHTLLYKGETAHSFYLVVFRPEGMETGEFQAFRNSLREYAEAEVRSEATFEWLKEHSAPVLTDPHIFLGEK